MKIISHRGYWKSIEEKNSVDAFQRSFSLNFGTETDFRDFNGEIVISHDIANSNCVSANNFFEIFIGYDISLPLALNIKADGLQKKLKALVELYNVKNYFVFDMSIPDTLGYIENGIIFYSRQSEYESEPAFYEKCSGIWLDAFSERWYDVKTITNHIGNNKQVAIVSPDLHKRTPHILWQFLKENNLHISDKILLCTDVPEEAEMFFKM